jgi:hypothetical protein
MASLVCAQAPSAAFSKDGVLWVAWGFSGHIYVQHSKDQGNTFSSPVAVNVTPENIAARAENRPKIQLDDDNNIYISWTTLLPKPYTGNVRFSRSTNHGKSFSKPITVNSDTQQISHRFDALGVTPDGNVYVSWLDKRDAIIAKQKNTSYLGGAIYYTVSTNQGKTFHENMKLADQSCVCCRIAIAIDNNNLPVIAWRDIYGDQIRDHSIVTFKSPTQPNNPQRLSFEKWRIEGCPHHGPALDIDTENTIHAVWFNETDSDHVLFYANNKTHTSSYTSPLGFGNPNNQSSHPYVKTTNKDVYLVWKEFDGKATRIMLNISNDNGNTWKEAQSISSTEGASDHPTLVSHKNDVYLSWHRAGLGYQLLLLNKFNK